MFRYTVNGKSFKDMDDINYTVKLQKLRGHGWDVIEDVEYTVLPENMGSENTDSEDTYSEGVDTLIIQED